MRRVLTWVVGLTVAAAIALAAYVRLAPSDPDVWHVDPMAVAEAGAANAWLAAPEGAAAAPDQPGPVAETSPEALAAAFDAVVMAAPRTSRLAGAPEEGWTTYVQRSRIMGFPDFISVRAVALEDGRAALAIYSRSRFGGDDWGVNEARVKAWLERLAAG